MGDGLEHFTPAAQEALRFGRMEATRMHHATIGPEHIFLGLLLESDGLAGRILRDLGVRPSVAQKSVERLSGAPPLRTGTDPDLRASTKALLQLAVEEARRWNSTFVDTQHLLLALLRQQDALVVAILIQAGISVDVVRRRVEQVLGMLPENMRREDRPPSGDSVVSQVARDLTELARKNRLDPVIGRQKEIERVIQILARRTKNNPALIGEPGVGKTAIVEGLAQRIIAGQVPGPILGKRVIQLDIGSLLAGTMYRGQFEERLKRLLDELRGSNTIVFIDEVHMLVGAGAAGSSVDAANILKPVLARGELQCVGATTLDEYRKYIEADPALERRFQPVFVEEPSPEETLEILRGIKYAYEEHHRLRISDEALQSAVRLSARYVTGRYLPDKAIDLMDEAASRVRMYKSPLALSLRKTYEELQELRLQRSRLVSEGHYNELPALEAQEEMLEVTMQHLRERQGQEDEGLVVTPDDIAEIVSMWTGIPLLQIAEEESARLLNMESILQQRIVGQDEAIRQVAQAVRRARAGLKDPRRPIGTFIFLGPTGVGKTELAKALAEFLFGSDEALIQLDMSEFMERHTVARLVGAPPGYVGYEDAGQLTEAVRRRPYSIIVFDEIEKAHPDAHNMLLQVMEEGALSDARGRRVDFRNTIIILTSNLGTEELRRQGRLGFTLPVTSQERELEYAELSHRLQEEIKRLFRPEFLNRVDGIIVFRPLDSDALRRIVYLEVEKVRQRLREQNLDLHLTEAAYTWLAAHGYSEEYGARPLKRLIQQEIETPISEALLSGKFSAGDLIVLDVETDHLVLHPAPEPENVREH